MAETKSSSIAVIVAIVAALLVLPCLLCLGGAAYFLIDSAPREVQMEPAKPVKAVDDENSP